MIERLLEKAKCKENWIKPRNKCADCNLSEYGKWDMRVKEAVLLFQGGEGYMEECMRRRE